MTPSPENAVTSTTPETAQTRSNRTEDRFDELLRAHYQKPLHEFSTLYLNKLAEEFKILRAVMYVQKTDDDENRTFVAVSTYGIDPGKLQQKEFQPGDSVIGQVVADGVHRLFNDLPVSNEGVQAGISYLHPQSMLILPLAFNEDIYGAICLERLTNFDPSEVQQLQQLSRNLASTLQGILNNQRLQSLLAETRQQADEISAREEEMRQNMEELQTTQEEMNRIQQELYEKQDVIDTLFDKAPFGILISEFENGEIKMANDRYAEILGSTADKVKGQSTVDTYANVGERKALKEYINKHGEVTNYKVHLQRFDNQESVPILYNLKLIEYEGKKHFFGAVIRSNEAE